jgi:hypothetical protein
MVLLIPGATPKVQMGAYNNLDILPTVLDLFNVSRSIRKEYPGNSMLYPPPVDHLTFAQTQARLPFFSHSGSFKAVITVDYNLCGWNLANDPLQKQSLCLKIHHGTESWYSLSSKHVSDVSSSFFDPKLRDFIRLAGGEMTGVMNESHDDYFNIQGYDACRTGILDKLKKK